MSASQKLRDGVELRDTTSSGTAARYAILELFQVIEGDRLRGRDSRQIGMDRGRSRG
jgi:hypothetical protein